MPFTCQTCAKRKVKCDKTAPICSTCRQGKLECFYQAPALRVRKRKLSNDVLERLDRYERILRQHGLLDAVTSPSAEGQASQDSINLYWNTSETSGKGRLLASHGKSRYIDSNLWRNLGDDEMQRLSDHEEQDEEPVAGLALGPLSDPLTGAFMEVGSGDSLLRYHPSQSDSVLLWETHRDNVEPICKILHIPSAAKMVEKASQQPATVSKVEACQLFAIYHFSVFSMTSEECEEKLGQSRDALMRRYHFATREALVNASFLKTTEVSVLQALVLFLIPCRHSYDPHTYWILTGVAVRIAQRMGLHRDGEKMGLPPFDVQMRRRLFYQLLPLDGQASQISGTGISMMPDAWDTQQPLNINDDQIWPDMTETPQEQKAATDMIFCISRSQVGSFLARAGKSADGAGTWQFEDQQKAEAAIKQAESEVEEKYIRYCDIVNPLHFLTIGVARSGITFMRLRIRLPKVRNNKATDADRREMFQLAQKIIDTDTAAHSHTGLKRFGWHVRPFFLWGTWDSLIFVLTTLWRRPDLLSPPETNAAWNKVAQVYHNHHELLESKRTLHVAFRRMTLKAWDANPLNRSAPEPDFIDSLRSLRKAKTQRRSMDQPISTEPGHGTTNTAPATGLSTPSDAIASMDSGSDTSLWMGNDFELEATDWIFWDQLMQADQQMQSG